MLFILFLHTLLISVLSYEFSVIRLSMFFCYTSLFLFFRTDPYATNITDRNIEYVFNVYDIITEYSDATLDESQDCNAAYYISSCMVCQATNSTETTIFSDNGKTITSSCLTVKNFVSFCLFCQFR